MHWTTKHITYCTESKMFIAWDETGAQDIGIYQTYQMASDALVGYDKYLNISGQVGYAVTKYIEELTQF